MRDNPVPHYVGLGETAFGLAGSVDQYANLTQTGTHDWRHDAGEYNFHRRLLMTSLITQPEQFIFARDQELRTSSLKVAAAFSKRHDDVLKRIRNIDCSPEFNARNFAEVKYKDAKGELRPMYEMTKDGFMFLVMGFTGKKAATIKEAYINAFNLMYDKLFAQPKTITKAQQGILYNRVKTIAKESGKIRAELWSRFQNHFQLASYKDLPADRFDDACAYLDEKEKEYCNGVKMLYISEAELEKRVSEKARAIEGDLLSRPDPEDTDIEQWVEKLRGEGYLVAKPNPNDLRKMLRSYMPLSVFKEFVKIIKAHMEATGFTDIDIHGDSLQFNFSSFDNRARVVLSRDHHGVTIQVIDPNAWILTPEQIKQHIDRILPGYTLIPS